jgi:hypothetical protein
VFEGRFLKADASGVKWDASLNAFENRFLKADASGVKWDASFNAFENRFARSDASGVQWDASLNTMFISATNLSNSHSNLEATVATKASLSGATFTGEIYTNSNITLTDTSTIRAPTGIFDNIRVNQRGIFTDGSYGNIDISNTIIAKKGVFTDVSLTNLSLSSLKYDASNSAAGLVLTSDATGNITLQPVTAVSEGAQIALNLKANLAGATFTGPIYSNSNISLNNNAILSAPKLIVVDGSS